MSLTSIINITMELVCFIILIALFGSLIMTKANKTKSEKILLALLLISCVYMLNDAIGWYITGRTEEFVRPLLTASNLLLYILGYSLMTLFPYYIITYVSNGKSRLLNNVLRIMVTTNCVMICFFIISQFNGFIYYIGPDNSFQFGPYYIITFIYELACLAVMMTLVIYYHRKFGSNVIGIFLFGIILLSIVTIAGLLFIDIMFTVVAITVGIIVLYVSVQVQHEKNAIEKELALKTSVTLSQIKPHFLYNSLSAIKYLSKDDPKTQNAIIAFAEYLRGNMDSMGIEKLVTVDRELEHVKQYLELEKLRFEERIKIEYDIDVKNFKLPALTLQPIVENAVKHGITKNDNGGIIKIRTEEDEQNFIIKIEDDGIGFDVNEIKDDDRSHLGISIVRTRLSSMTNGKLSIESKKGKGTVVVMEIPKIFRSGK